MQSLNKLFNIFFIFLMEEGSPKAEGPRAHKSHEVTLTKSMANECSRLSLTPFSEPRFVPLGLMSVPRQLSPPETTPGDNANSRSRNE